MFRTQCTIGCLPHQLDLAQTLIPILKVYAQFSMSTQLRWKWSYVSESECDIYFIDLDDDFPELTQVQEQTTIYMSSDPDLLKGHDYVVSKPLKRQKFLSILQQIERNGLHKKMSDPRPVREEEPLMISEVQGGEVKLEKSVTYQLCHWPDLTRISDDVLPMVSRLCAFLAISPSTMPDLVEFFDISKTEIDELIGVIEDASFDGYRTIIANGDVLNDELGQTQKTVQKTRKASSFLSKIWNKLLLENT